MKKALGASTDKRSFRLGYDGRRVYEIRTADYFNTGWVSAGGKMVVKNDWTLAVQRNKSFYPSLTVVIQYAF